MLCLRPGIPAQHGLGPDKEELASPVPVEATANEPEELRSGPEARLIRDSGPARGWVSYWRCGAPTVQWPRVDRWQGRLAGLEDRLADWTYRWIEAHPTIADQVERRLHAFGLHGPSARHLLRTRVVPIGVLVAALLALLFLFVVFRLCWWALGRRRGRRLAIRTASAQYAVSRTRRRVAQDWPEHKAKSG